MVILKGGTKRSEVGKAIDLLWCFVGAKPDGAADGALTSIRIGEHTDFGVFASVNP